MDHNYPPWLPTPQNTHTGRLLAIARCIHQKFLRTEIHDELGPMKLFNNYSIGPLELATHVLGNAGFVEFLDDVPVRSVFTCEPSEFESVATSSKAQHTNHELVKQAISRLAEPSLDCTEEVLILAEIIDKEY